MLEKQVDKARKEIAADGYDISVGELINIYKDSELNIAPEYQRLFRWSDYQKTRFIETLLLGLPIPPIFVYQKDDGKWELIDGLQRVSTILEFVGALPDYEPSTLSGTNYLPDLAGKRWDPSTPKAKDSIGTSLQIQIKRQRLRVEILKKESDGNAKYELFQRLNTGGTKLTEQEVRHCVIVMMNPESSKIVKDLANLEDFKSVTCLTEEQIARKFDEELVIRVFAIANLEYQAGLDVHEFLDTAAIHFCKLSKAKQAAFISMFKGIFEKVNKACGKNSFRSAPGGRSGQFQLGKFETVIAGLSSNWSIAKAKPDSWLNRKIASIHSDPEFTKNSGAGIRGTTRFTHLIPFGRKHFKK